VCGGDHRSRVGCDGQRVGSVQARTSSSSAAPTLATALATGESPNTCTSSGRSGVGERDRTSNKRSEVTRSWRLGAIPRKSSLLPLILRNSRSPPTSPLSNAYAMEVYHLIARIQKSRFTRRSESPFGKGEKQSSTRW
jgi:hypothetical protein